jgi:hypothetical protein
MYVYLYNVQEHTKIKRCDKVYKVYQYLWPDFYVRIHFNTPSQVQLRHNAENYVDMKHGTKNIPALNCRVTTFYTTWPI